MLSGIDLNQIITFPFKDAESRRNFLIGCLVSLTAFIVPILPYFVLYGYAARIAKQILDNESPRMAAWDDWEGMIKDGIRLFGVRMVYSLPVLIVIFPMFIFMVAMPFFMSNASSSELDVAIPAFMLVFFGLMCALIPISIPLAVITPAAEMYVVDKNEFAAGFRFREWWSIFRANIGGFIAAFVIYYMSTMILMFAVQIIGATLIFACLVPLLLPALVIYGLLIMYTAGAQAYKNGRDKLAQSETNAGS
jgi:hypothetical protein